MTIPPPPAPGFDPQQGPAVPQQPAPYGNQPPQFGQQPPYGQYGFDGQQPKGGKGMAIASMILGIVSLVLCFYWFLGLPTALVGLILGIVAINRASRNFGAGKGFAISGIVTSGLGLLLGVFMFFVWLTPEFQDSFWEGFCEGSNGTSSVCEGR